MWRHLSHLMIYFNPGAVSTTGDGECLMRSLAAYEIAIGMGRLHLSPNIAIRSALDNMSSTVGGDGMFFRISIIILNVTIHSVTFIYIFLHYFILLK